jgi:hypothetical protein
VDQSTAQNQTIWKYEAYRVAEQSFCALDPEVAVLHRAPNFERDVASCQQAMYGHPARC